MYGQRLPVEKIGGPAYHPQAVDEGECCLPGSKADGEDRPVECAKLAGGQRMERILRETRIVLP